MKRTKDILDKTIFRREFFIFLYVLGICVEGVIYHISPTVLDIYTYIIFVWAVLLIVRDIWKRDVEVSLTQLLFLLFVGIVAASIVFQLKEPISKHFNTIITMLIWVYILFSAWQHITQEKIIRLIEIISAVVVAYTFLLASVSLISLITYQAGIILPFGLNSPERIFTYGHFGNENRFCGLFGYSTSGGDACVIAILLALLLFERKRISMIGVSVISAVLSVTVYCLDVRASEIVLLFILLVIVYRFLKTKIGTGKTILLLIGILIITGIAVFILKHERIMMLLEAIQVDPVQALQDYSSGRTTMWRRVIYAFPQHPFLGFGWGNYYPQEFVDSHNLIFNLLGWTGLSGFLVFMTGLVMVFRDSIRNKKIWSSLHINWLFIMMICVFINSMLERTLMSTYTNTETAMFWISAGLLSNLHKNGKTYE